MRSPAARFTGIAIATALAVVFFCLAAADAVAAVSPDGTWFDVIGALTCMAAAVGCGALAVGGTR